MVNKVLIAKPMTDPSTRHVQSLFHHHQSSRDHRAVPRRQPLRRQPRADDRRVPGLSGPGHPKYRRGRWLGHDTDALGHDTDALGHAAATAHRRPAGHQHPQHVIAALAHVAQAGEQVLGPGQQLRRVRAGAEPRDEEEGRGGFAINEDRPLFAFGGIWTTFSGDRGTKSKPIPGPHQVYGFLTTSPNSVVAPIHPKAMPVILTTEEERDV
jgi:hypothetical protein